MSRGRRSTCSVEADCVVCLSLLLTLGCADLQFVNADTNAGAAGSPFNAAGNASGGSAGDGAGGSAAGAAATPGGQSTSGGGQGEGGMSEADSGGEGGAPALSCPHADGALRASVHPEFSENTLNELHPFVLLTNDGPGVELHRVRARYYFTAESGGDFRTACYWVTNVAGDGGSCDRAELEVVTMNQPTAEADSYLELSFPSETATLPKGVKLEFRAGFWLDSRMSFSQENDYSFVATTDVVTEVSGFPYRGTTKVTLYVDDLLVWGTEPCDLP